MTNRSLALRALADNLVTAKRMHSNDSHRVRTLSGFQARVCEHGHFSPSAGIKFVKVEALNVPTPHLLVLLENHALFTASALHQALKHISERPGSNLLALS